MLPMSVSLYMQLPLQCSGLSCLTHVQRTWLVLMLLLLLLLRLFVLLLLEPLDLLHHVGCCCYDLLNVCLALRAAAGPAEELVHHV